MSTIEQIFDALHDTVQQHLGATASGSCLIAFESGTPIPNETFRLNDEARTLSPALAQDFISNLADTLPEVAESLFSRRMATVEATYGLILAGAMPADAAATALLGAARGKAETDFDVEIDALQAGLGRYRPVNAIPSNWYDLSADGNWTTISIGAADDPPLTRQPRRFSPALTEWKTLDPGDKMILVKPLDVQLFEPEPSPSVVEASHTTDPHTVVAKPSAVAINKVFLRNAVLTEDPQLRLNHQTVQRVSARRNFSETAIKSGMILKQRTGSNKLSVYTAARLRTLTDIVAANATPKPISTDSLSISFRLCLVQMNRPWFSQALLSLPGWYLPGFSKGSLSDAVSLTAPMALVPTACILIRDLSIKGQWSEEDKATVANAASFGPLSLLGRDYDDGAATITVAGMQSIGWVCERMPILPPVNDPALPTT